jgi:hypothetical protein
MFRRNPSKALPVLLLLASCGSSLGDPGQPGPTLPEWTDADCTMFDATACKLDVAKTSIGIDVHYPNTIFCRLQLLPTIDLLGARDVMQLATTWQVTMSNAARDQVVIAPEVPRAEIEYPLGTERLYLTRVTFSSKSSDTLATLVSNALGSGVSLFAVPLECPGQR